MFFRAKRDRLIIDVRDKNEHQNSNEYIKKNSINISLKELEATIKKMKIKKDKQIFVFCLSGKRSKVASDILKEMGYTNVVNVGSYQNLSMYL